MFICSPKSRKKKLGAGFYMNSQNLQPHKPAMSPTSTNFLGQSRGWRTPSPRKKIWDRRPTVDRRGRHSTQQIAPRKFVLESGENAYVPMSVSGSALILDTASASWSPFRFTMTTLHLRSLLLLSNLLSL